MSLSQLKLKYRDRQATPDTVWTNPIHFIACGFGIGAIPWMPGTFGTLLGVLVYLMIVPLHLSLYCTITFLLILLGIWICGVVNRDFGTDDHPAAVWDEVASFPVVMIAIPHTWYFIVLGFVLFRFFDIVKPGPIGWIDRHLHGGLGVMMDDVLAAFFSWIILFFIAKVIL